MLDFHFWRLKASPVAWTSFMEAQWSKIEYIKFFFQLLIFSIFGHKNPGSGSRHKNPGFGLDPEPIQP